MSQVSVSFPLFLEFKPESISEMIGTFPDNVAGLKIMMLKRGSKYTVQIPLIKNTSN